MYCDRCGRPVRNGTTLCPYCGQYLPPSRHAEMIGPPSPQRMQQYYSGNYHGGGGSYRRRRNGCGCAGGCGAAVLILILLLAFGFILLMITLGRQTDSPQDPSWPSSSSSSSSEQSQPAADPVIGRWNNTKVEYGSRTYPADDQVYVTFYANGSVKLMVDGDEYSGTWQDGAEKSGGTASYELTFSSRNYYPYCYLYRNQGETLVIGVSGGYVMYFSR